MIQFDADYVDKLNEQYKGGRFIKAAIVTENLSPLTLKYWADNAEPLVFQGNTYQPLKMRWEGIKTSQGMLLQGATLTVSNIGGAASSYLRTMDITGNPCTIQLLHADLLNTLTNYWQRKYKILGLNANNMVATFTVGRNLGRNKLPRGVILSDEFPGISNDVPRIL